MPPRYTLNPLVVDGTIEPPVSVARSWVYPRPGAPEPQRPLINLSQGVPGVPPPAPFVRRLHAQPVDWGYGDNFGAPRLRQALARDLNHVYRPHDSAASTARQAVKVEDICITAGSNLAFATIAQVLAARGHAILLPTPWYFNHYMTLTALGIAAVPVPTVAPSFEVDPAAVRAALAAARQQGTQPKALVIVTPNNPTGAVYSPTLLAQLALLAREERIALVLDETYKDFLLAPDTPAHVHGGQRHRAAPHTLFEDTLPGAQDWDWRETVVQLVSFSKSLAIPGHRLGALVAHPSLMGEVDRPIDPTRDILDPAQRSNVLSYGPVAKVVDDLQICPPVGSTQDVVAWALADKEMVKWRADEAAAIELRRDAFAHDLAKVHVRSTQNGGWAVESSGGYYAYVRHPWAAQLDSESVARALATLVGVKTLPGAFFMPPSAPEKVPPPAKAADFPLRQGYTEDNPKDRLRFSVANVDLKTLQEVPERLQLLDRLWAERGIGFGLPPFMGKDATPARAGVCVPEQGLPSFLSASKERKK